MSRDLIACCEGIKVLRGDGLKFGDDNPPIRYFGKQEYYFGHYNPIEFCPSCGTNFRNFFDGISNIGISNEDDKPNSPDFCCYGMESVSVPSKEGECEDDFEIFYEPFTRRYFFSESRYLRHWDTGEKTLKEWDFYYCIYCGKKLPDNLSKQWLELVQRECGIIPKTLLDKVLSDIPDEFKTDAWWKNRGL